MRVNASFYDRLTHIRRLKVLPDRLSQTMSVANSIVPSSTGDENRTVINLRRKGERGSRYPLVRDSRRRDSTIENSRMIFKSPPSPSRSNGTPRLTAPFKVHSDNLSGTAARARARARASQPANLVFLPAARRGALASVSNYANSRVARAPPPVVSTARAEHVRKLWPASADRASMSFSRLEERPESVLKVRLPMRVPSRTRGRACYFRPALCAERAGGLGTQMYANRSRIYTKSRFFFPLYIGRNPLDRHGRCWAANLPDDRRQE